MLASSKPIHCFSPLSRKLDVGWPRIEDFQLRGHSCVNNVQQCLCHFYTWMRHSKQTATLLLTKRHANFDTSTSAKGYARVYELRMRNCSPWHTACSGSPHNALHSSSWGEPERAPHRRYSWEISYMYYWGEPERAPHRRYNWEISYMYYYHYRTTITRAPRLVARSM